MRYYLTLIRTIIKKTRNNKYWQGCGEKGTLVHCLWECIFVQLLWKIVWGFLKKLKIKLQYDPAIPLLDIFPKKLKIFTLKGIWGFPGGAVVENLPANAGDTGSSPGLGRSHMPRSN